MSDNEALRSILGELRAQNALLLGKYETLEGNQNRPVTSTLSVIRGPKGKAMKTVLTNQGANPCEIWEDGKLVYILDPKKTWTSPLNGGGNLQAKCATGQTTTLAHATYLSA